MQLVFIELLIKCGTIFTITECRMCQNLGQGQSDFRCFNDVLKQAVGTGNDVSRFIHANPNNLRRLGHGAAAAKWKVDEMNDKVKCPVDVFDWMPGLQFGHALLPCATAEVSATADKGMTRLCFPFINVCGSMDPERAIASLCALTWFLAFTQERELVETGRLCRIAHKMRIKEEDGDLWFNKSCGSDRVATAIKDGKKNVLYMYVGGGAVDHEQSHLLSGLVVLCKSWRWAALAYAAARVAGLASNNFLDSFQTELVIPFHDAASDSTASEPTPDVAFLRLCDDLWCRIQKSCNHWLFQVPKDQRFDKQMLTMQAGHVCSELTRLKSVHTAAIQTLLSESE